VPTFSFCGDASTPRSEQLTGVRAAAERVAQSYGLEVFDVQLRRETIGTVLRVVIDRPDRGVPETFDEAVGIEECQRVSHDLSALLDVEDEELEAAGALAQNYTLEVSSPGLDRPLRHEADYRRFTGRLAKVVTTAPIEGQTAFAGRIVAVEDGAVTLEEGRRRHRVPVALIKRGQLAVEF
jgi:ribosome maturation factor RimP